MLKEDAVQQGVVSFFAAATLFGVMLLIAPFTTLTVGVPILFGGVSFFSGLYYRKREREKLANGNEHLTHR